MEQTRVLTLINYGDTEDEIARVTIAPHHVMTVIAGEADIIKFGRALKKTNVLFLDGGNVEIHISAMDLTTLEEAVGTYVLP